jgi:uncharacterized membrane protein YfcA
MSYEYILLAVTALLASALTLFSGFGLGTLLLPAFALFFPVGVAVAATAIVHLVNNLFKLSLLWRDTDWGVAARFALPAALAALPGAALLFFLGDLPALLTYRLGERICEVTAVRLAIAGLIIFFACLDLVPGLGERLAFRKEHLPLGAALSGFFGGLSGHQGALRSAVLLRFGLTKAAFIATGVVCAVVVDITRLVVYGTTFYHEDFRQLVQGGGVALVTFASLAAFLGAFLATKLIKKVTMPMVRRLVGMMLIILAAALAAGIA